MKHSEHILAFDKERFGHIGTGVQLMALEHFIGRADESLIIARRRELESNEKFGQMLPYIVLWQRGIDGKPRIFTYQRGKGVGESRLAGAYSIGVGGHVDVADVVHNFSVIDVAMTMSKAANRELDEEIAFLEGAGGPAQDMFAIRALWGDVPTFEGLINDDSDAVGRVHYGAIHLMQIPIGLEPRCREPELLTCGLKTLDELHGMRDQLENWSRLIIDAAHVIFEY